MAALIITEDELAKNPDILAQKTIGLLRAPKILQGLGKNFGIFAKPDAARDMAEMIMTTVRRQGRRRR